MDPLLEDQRGRRLAHFMWDELEKIAEGAAPAQATTGTQQSGELEGGIQRGAEGSAEASPAHGVVASRVEQLGDKTARGTPILQPPPGFVYSPELQAFVPDPNDPGWMSVQQQVGAQHNQAWYQQGQQDTQQGQAQQELDQQVAQQTQAATQEQQMAQQTQAGQMQAAAAAPQMQAKEQAKAQAKSTMGGLTTPSSVKGSEKKTSTPKKPTAPKSEKGVTIKIGK